MNVNFFDKFDQQLDEYDLNAAVSKAYFDLRTAEYYRYFKDFALVAERALSSHAAAYEAYILAQRIGLPR